MTINSILEEIINLAKKYSACQIQYLYKIKKSK